MNHCLEKNPEARFHSANDLAFALEALSTGSGPTAQTVTTTPRRPENRERLVWIGGMALLSLVTLWLAVRHITRPQAGEQAARFAVALPESATSLNALAISPDGRYLAFAATAADGRSMLWVRPLDSLDAQPLAGTEDAAHPFWSPDSRFVAFHAGDGLRKIALSGGPPQTICKANGAVSGTWSHDGIIIFASTQYSPGPQGVLYRVSASGGEATPLTMLDTARRELSHTWSQFLPDGRRFIYRIRQANWSEDGLYLGSLDGQEAKRLLTARSNVAYAPPGYLLLLRAGTLVAQPFDADKLELTGDPLTINEGLLIGPLGFLPISVSETGTLVYRSSGSETRLSLYDRTGTELGRISPPGVQMSQPALSPDEERVATGYRTAGGSWDIWLIDLARGNVASRFTFDLVDEYCAVWSPDRSRIVYASNQGDAGSLRQKPVSAAGAEDVLLNSSEFVLPFPCDWSPDGQHLLFASFDPQMRADLWLLPFSGKRKPARFLQTPFDELHATISPDGRWVAYTSDESGRNEVYVRSFPAGGDKIKVSTEGGGDPRWRRDGKELFYLSPDLKLVAVEVSASPRFTTGVPKPLFQTRVTGLVDFRNHYLVAANGQRLIVNNESRETTSAPITVVLNWTADLKR